jgi:multidrug efflux system outer membrane protein
VRLDSTILLRRPDVAQAEFTLRASYANVDAARAALYPKITLTGVAGVATTALSSLFSPTNFAWGLTSAASWPIFKGGGQGHLSRQPGPARRRSGHLSQNGADRVSGCRQCPGPSRHD